MKIDITDVYEMKETVLTLADLSVGFVSVDYDNLKRKLHYWVKSGKLLRIRRGIYAKEGYSKHELANKLVRPSYISFETVLIEKGVMFQAYESMFLASRVSKQIEIGKDVYIYRRLDEKLLLNMTGIEKRNNYFRANLERAFLDILYLKKDCWFDNLGPINWDKVFEILPIYNNKSLNTRVKKYFKDFKNDNV